MRAKVVKMESKKRRKMAINRLKNFLHSSKTITNVLNALSVIN